RAHVAARRAAEVMAVPFYAVLPPQATPGADEHTVDVAAVLDRKIRAMQAHRTQITVEGDHFALSSGPSMPVAASESYRRLDGPEGEVPFSRQPVAARVLAC